MTVHFYMFSDRVAPSSRQRGYYVAELLREKGINTVIHTPTVLSMSKTPWPRKASLIIEFVRSLFTIKKGDIVFLQRAVYNKFFFVIMVAYLIVSRRKMIFDFDDPIYTHNYLKTKTFSKMASAVITCTHAQGEWAKQFNKNVHVIHIAIDPTPYINCTKDYSVRPEKPVIGWLGTGPEHMKNLPILVPVFKRLVEQNVAFSFVLIGAFGDKDVYALFQDIPGLDVRFIDRIAYTDPESAPKEIRKFDIGVVPHQSDGVWNKGKTSMKVLEYMACAVPAMVSDFGEMPYMIKDGVNGYVASSEDEWVEKLSGLLHDQGLREQLGRAGQETVRERYSFEAIIPQIAKIIHSLEGDSRR
ncbi:glycosyltransferase family 4 protein [Candidatus Kaiserbacteria bacterium]|nr:glycosyltransferase family 4 protein [Candidatus Kaiserbacteria bacterium]